MRTLTAVALTMALATPAFAQTTSNHSWNGIFEVIGVTIIVLLVLRIIHAWKSSPNKPSADDIAVDAAAEIIKVKRHAEARWNDFVSKAKNKADQ